MKAHQHHGRHIGKGKLHTGVKKEFTGNVGGDNELGDERHHLGGFGGEAINLGDGGVVKTPPNARRFGHHGHHHHGRGAKKI
jgi:hypothetical protein